MLLPRWQASDVVEPSLAEASRMSPRQVVRLASARWLHQLGPEYNLWAYVRLRQSAFRGEMSGV